MKHLQLKGLYYLSSMKFTVITLCIFPGTQVFFPIILNECCEPVRTLVGHFWKMEDTRSTGFKVMINALTCHRCFTIQTGKSMVHRIRYGVHRKLFQKHYLACNCKEARWYYQIHTVWQIVQCLWETTGRHKTVEEKQSHAPPICTSVRWGRYLYGYKEFG